MTNRRPDTAKLVLHVLDRSDEGIDVWLCVVAEQLVEPRTIVSNYLLDRG